MYELIQLIISFMKVGLFSIGGGYASLPLIQEEVIGVHHWISETQFTDLITISQMTPGPIAINTATFVGNIVHGIPGSIAATIGCVFPSIVIVLILAKIYFRYQNIAFMDGILRGLRPAVTALIGGAGITIVYNAFFGENIYKQTGSVDLVSVGLFVMALVALRKWNLNPIYIMLGTGVCGAAIYLI